MGGSIDWNPWLEKAASEVGVEGVAIFVNDPETRRSRRMAWAGEEPREWVPYGVTPLGECAGDGLPRRREVRNTKDLKYHSYLYLPLGEGDARLGVVVFSAVQPEHFALEGRQEKATSWSRLLANVFRDSSPH